MRPPVPNSDVDPEDEADAGPSGAAAPAPETGPPATEHEPHPRLHAAEEQVHREVVAVAKVVDPDDFSDDDDDEEEDDEPRFDLGRKQIIFGLVAVAVIVGVLYVGLPLLPGVAESFGRIKDGQPLWLAASFGFSFASFVGYVILFRGVHQLKDSDRMTFSASYQIVMAGLAATRILAAGGAGGLVMSAWALRQAGMDRREVADRTLTFLCLMYFPFMLAIIVGGLGLRWGLFPGPHTWGITVLPALFGAAALALAIGTALIPSDLERRLAKSAAGGGRFSRIAARLANLPAAMSTGVRGAWEHARHGDFVTFGAFLYWAAQVASLWAAYRAFGSSPPVAVVTLGFFLGMIGNLLPLPGGVGGVGGGTIGALAALGHGGGVAVAAVLTYRVFAFWLPTIPGFIAYLQLRRTVAGWKEERRQERAAARAAGGTGRPGSESPAAG
ncbi:MAG: lysylphosphatidylglycerol synthase transmembrane domain-containing protein [Solirubrobacteraceae bacterium]